MRRGFKAEAERAAQRIRREMRLRQSDPMDAIELANHIGARVESAENLTSLGKLQTLEMLQPGAFSACTFSIGRRHIIVYNPLASEGRTQSDIAHEVAHLVLEHNMNTVQTVGAVSLFTCDPDEEQEANWLAGCLLLPRTLLYQAVKRGMDGAMIADTYNVSESMASFRLRVTGVLKQLEAAKRRTRRA